MKHNHFNYGIILIQKNANVKVPVYDEFPNRIAKQWKDEEEAKKKAEEEEKGEAAKATGDVEMEEDDGDAANKKHRDMFAG